MITNLSFKSNRGFPRTVETLMILSQTLITLNFRYMHKRAEIDYAIAKRVNKLYKVLEHRFGASGDIKIW